MQDLDVNLATMLATINEQWSELCGVAGEFIGPDEDGQPECSCCGMQLETLSRGHKGDCLATMILESQLTCLLRNVTKLVGGDK